MESSDIFGIGAVYQSELNFSVKSKAISSIYIYDQKIDMQFGLLLENGETEWIPLGVYYIQDMETSGQVTKIKALDRMSDLDVSTVWTTGQSHTFETVMETITEQTGVEFAQTFDEIENLTSVALWQYYSFSEYNTYRDVLREIAQIFGGFAFINRDGKIEFKRLDNIDPVAEIPSNRRYSLTLSERDFNVAKIQYTKQDGEIFTKNIVGNGATVYFDNNGFLENYSDPSLQLSGIAESLKNIQYASGTIEYSGNPAFDIGDYVKVTGGDANDNVMLIGSDNWIFRGVQTLTAPTCETSYSSSGNSGSNGTDGKDGKDGFSPTITEYENTDTSYILKITNKNGYTLTPNLLKNIVIDSFLSETSENAVQNKIITLKLKEFDSMFEEIKKLLEEIKNLVGTDNGNKLYGLIQADFGGLEGISGNLVKESED